MGIANHDQAEWATYDRHRPELRTVGGEVLIVCHCGDWTSHPGLSRTMRLVTWRNHVQEATLPAIGNHREGVESIEVLSARLHRVHSQTRQDQADESSVNKTA